MKENIDIYIVFQDGTELHNLLNSQQDKYSMIMDTEIVDEKLLESKMMVISSHDEKWAYQQTSYIRSHPDGALVPVMVVLKGPCSRPLSDIVDSCITPGFSAWDLTAEIERLLSIQRQLESFRPVPEEMPLEDKRKINLLRFMLNRSVSVLEPLTSISSSCGYEYPIARETLGERGGVEIGHLEDLERSGLVTGVIKDKVHICPFCSKYNINFRECCPACRAVDIEMSENIHHFSCGHMAPEPDFVKGMDYVCPKCGKVLRHIGVDYEKASQIYRCASCQETFMESTVDCLCLACEKIFLSEEAVLQSIKRYQITSKGGTVAEDGQLPGKELENILRGVLGLYNFDFFKRFLELEVQRCRRYKRTFSIISFRIENFDALQQKLGIRSTTRLVQDVAEVLKGVIRNTDIASDYKENNILILLTETPAEGAAVAQNKVKQGISEALEEELLFETRLVSYPQDGETAEDLLINLTQGEVQ